MSSLPSLGNHAIVTIIRKACKYDRRPLGWKLSYTFQFLLSKQTAKTNDLMIATEETI